MFYRLAIGFLLAGSVMLAGGPGIAMAQACWDCDADLHDCTWNDAEQIWECEGGTVFCDHVDPESAHAGWVDCDDNQTQTYCSTGSYMECEKPVLLPAGLQTEMLEAPLLYVCAADVVGPDYAAQVAPSETASTLPLVGAQDAFILDVRGFRTEGQ